MHGLGDIIAGLTDEGIKDLKAIMCADPIKHREGETILKSEKSCDPKEYYPPEKGGKTDKEMYRPLF